VKVEELHIVCDIFATIAAADRKPDTYHLIKDALIAWRITLWKEAKSVDIVKNGQKK
jgi:hypothetical protein